MEPSQDELRQALLLLEALSNPRRAEHRAAVEALPAASQQSVFVMLMLHIFAQGPRYGVAPELREMAGVVLKNKCIRALGSSEAVVEMLRVSIMMGLADESAQIRRMAASLLGRVADAYEHTYWAPVLPQLLSTLQGASFDGSSNDTAYAIDGALHALKVLVEDSSAKLAMDPAAPLEALVPLLLRLLGAPVDAVRLNSLTTLNDLIMSYHNAPLLRHMDLYLQNLGRLASDPQPQIRRLVCQALVLLVSSHQQSLQACFHDVCAFMLTALEDADESVSVEAADYWLSLVGQEASHEALVQHLPRLLSTCLSRLVLTQQQMEREREDDEAQAEGSKNISFAHPRGSRGGGAEDADVQITARNQCAFLLDSLGVAFPQLTFYTVAPLLWAALQQAGAAGPGKEASLAREASILALGALAHGCRDQLADSLPSLLPLVLSAAGDALPECRAIACWCLSRYTWRVRDFFEEEEEESGGAGGGQPSSGHARGLLAAIVQALLGCLGDPMPRVQAAACSGLASVAAELEEHITPHLEAIISHLAKAWPRFGLKNRLVAMDTVAELALAVGEEMGDPRLTSLYLPLVLGFIGEHCPAASGAGSSSGSGSGSGSEVDAFLVVAPLECLASLFRRVPRQLMHVAPDALSLAVVLSRAGLDELNARGREASGAGFGGGDEDDEDEGGEDENTNDTLLAALELAAAIFEGLRTDACPLLFAPLPPAAPSSLFFDASSAAVGPGAAGTVGRGLALVVLQGMGSSSSSTSTSSSSPGSSPGGESRNADVSAYSVSVLGELAQLAPALMLPICSDQVFASLLTLATQPFAGSSDGAGSEEEEDEDNGAPLRNNVVWALGLVSRAQALLPPPPPLHSALEPYLPRLLHGLTTLIYATAQLPPQSLRLLKLNLAITFGRLVPLAPAAVAAVLPEVLTPLLRFLQGVSAPLVGSEEAEAWGGLLQLLAAQPALLSAPEARSEFAAAAVVALSSEEGQGQDELDTSVKASIEALSRAVGLP